jgi:hypothetical protein
MLCVLMRFLDAPGMKKSFALLFINVFAKIMIFDYENLLGTEAPKKIINKNRSY